MSGFSFWSYANNAVVFEGAATLPFRWNAKRSAMLDRLVLGGDFYTLAHAQKVCVACHRHWNAKTADPA